MNVRVGKTIREVIETTRLPPLSHDVHATNGDESKGASSRWVWWIVDAKSWTKMVFNIPAL